jgi:hypothetical protein
MRRSIWQIRLPTLLGILVIIIGTAATSLFIGRGFNIIGRASPTDEPQEVRLTNVSDTSFTVTYTTKAPNPGVLSYGEKEPFSQTVLDDRDQPTGIVKSYTTHHITVRNAKPNTQYLFSIVSGDNTYKNENDALFTVTTGPPIKEPTSQKPLVGKVTEDTGNPPSEALIYVTSEETQTISTIVKPDGTYILPLNSIRKKDLSSYATFSETAFLTMLLLNNEKQSTVSLLVNQINPVPPVTLSENYDFTLGTNPVSSPSGVFGFPSFVATQSATKNPVIISPSKEEAFKDDRPVFNGATIPNADVTILIESENEIETKVKSDSSGKWSFRPAVPLAPGKHTITVTAPDQFGILKTIKQSFTVYAQGSQFIEPSGPPPSITPTPTVKVTPTPTILPTISPTQAPTPTIKTTVAPSPTLIAQASPTRIATPSLVPTLIVQVEPTSASKGGIELSPTVTLPPPIPAVGSSTLVTTGIAGIMAFTVGLILFILTRGTIL